MNPHFLYRLPFCFVGLVLACWSMSIGAQQNMPRVLADALRIGSIPPAAVAFYVQEVGANNPVLDYNARKAMNPASTMKLVTTYAALDLLGPAYTWKTVAASTAAPAEVLEGDLIIKGSGDPKLVIENFWLLLRQLRQRGIREIRGDLVIDRSVFDLEPYDPALFDADPQRPYNVGADGLLINFNTVLYRFLPDAASRSVTVISEPRLGAGITVKPRLSDAPCGDWQTGLAADFSEARWTAFRGVYPLACGDKVLRVNQLSPDAFVAALFGQLWTEMGGVLSGTVRQGLMPANARVLAEHESPPLVDIVRDINKFSNNVMARQLYLSLAPQLAKQPGTTARSYRIVRDWLTRRGLPMPELVIDNGSGLSRTERISAHSMARLLQSAYASPIMSEFIASLPVAGSDGTLRRVLIGRPVAGRAHLKSGTLTDVRAIAGYVLASSGKRYVVVGMINHANTAGARLVFERLLEWSFEQG